MRNQKGFTLIELMIVLAIIAIVAAIAIDAWKGYNGGEVNTNGPVLPDTAVSYLVCKMADNVESSEPAIPGERWRFEGGVFVTNDASGNPITRPAGNCHVKS